MSDICIVCGCSETNLTQCKDLRLGQLYSKLLLSETMKQFWLFPKTKVFFQKEICQVSSVVQSRVHIEKRFRKD